MTAPLRQLPTRFSTAPNDHLTMSSARSASMRLATPAGKKSSAIVESLKRLGPLFFLLFSASFALNCVFFVANKPSSHLLADWGLTGERVEGTVSLTDLLQRCGNQTEAAPPPSPCECVCPPVSPSSLGINTPAAAMDETASTSTADSETASEAAAPTASQAGTAEPASNATSVAITPEESACFSLLEYPDRLVYKEKQQDPWALMKAFPPPSPCTLHGLRIEELEPHLNFRRGFTLKYTDNEEDRMHILPYFRAVQDAQMAKRARRFLIDLGGHQFHTSTEWFLHYYPLDFTEIHVFEVLKKRFKVPPARKAGFEDAKLRVKDQQHKMSIFWADSEHPNIPAWQLKRITLHEGLYVNSSDGQSSINITRFMRDVLRLTPADTVVVKMDIEEAEWLVLGDWLRDPEMPLIVDEIFVEMHYHHVTMTKYHWTPSRFNHSRAEATQFFNRLRAVGFFVHPWP